MHLSELATSTNSDSDTPALREVTSSEDGTPFNDVRALPKYGVDTPLDGSVACKYLGGNTCSHDTRFLEHLDCSMLMTMSVSTASSVFASESSAHAHSTECQPYRAHQRSLTTLVTI